MSRKVPFHYWFSSIRFSAFFLLFRQHIWKTSIDGDWEYSSREDKEEWGEWVSRKHYVTSILQYPILDISSHHFPLFHLVFSLFSALVLLTPSHSLSPCSALVMIEFYESSEYLSINHQTFEWKRRAGNGGSVEARMNMNKCSHI